MRENVLLQGAYSLNKFLFNRPANLKHEFLLRLKRRVNLDVAEKI